MLLVPCEPVPIAAITILSLAAVNPFFPKAEPGIILGKTITPAAADNEFLMKSLLVLSLLILNLFN